MSRLLAHLLHLLAPASCLGCQVPLEELVPLLGLCPPCRSRLLPYPRDGCPVCGRPLAPGAPPPGYVCGPCRAHPPAFHRLLALWHYQPPLDRVIHGLKFHRLDYLGGHLARCLAEELEAEMGRLDLVVPVPLHWRRRLARGYNQAEEIARPLATLLGLPLLRGLRRVRPTPPQTALSRRARLTNPRRAFRAQRGTLLAGKRVLLVDDVVTTAATLNAAAGALRRAGAEEVVALAVARTV